MVAVPLAGFLVFRSWRRTSERRWMIELLVWSGVIAGASVCLILKVGERADAYALADGVLLAVIFQTVLAAWLGSRLSRDMAARNFSLPQ